MTMESAPMKSMDSSLGASQTLDANRIRKPNQILDTILFEIQRNKIKLIMLCVLAAALFTIVAVVFALLPSRGFTRPANALDFLVSGLTIDVGSMMGGEEMGGAGGVMGITFFSGMGFSFVGTITCLCAAILGGPSIAGDWDKKTGHILFPKVDRLKLLIGRVVGLYIICAIVVSVFYILVAFYTGIVYGGVPPELLGSFGVAQLYAFTILCIVVFISSWMPNSTGAIILTIIFFIEVLMILTQVAMSFSTLEPLWSPSYLANLIPNVMKMPEPNVISDPTANPPSAYWLTPTLPMGVFILGLFSIVSLCLAYFFFRRRQI